MKNDCLVETEGQRDARMRKNGAAAIKRKILSAMRERRTMHAKAAGDLNNSDYEAAECREAEAGYMIYIVEKVKP